MGWFDEQIQQKIEDQENDLNDVLMEMAGIVMNDSFHVHFTGSRAVVRNATNELLTYFHKGEVEVPESITEPDQVLEYLCSVAGLMKRPVTLEHGWYRNLMGAMLGTLKEDGFRYLEQCRAWCGKYGLNLLIDLHECYGYSFDPLKKDMDRERFFYDENLQ